MKKSLRQALIVLMFYLCFVGAGLATVPLKLIVWYIPWRLREDNKNRTDYNFRVNVGSRQESECSVTYDPSRWPLGNAIIIFGGSNQFKCRKEDLPPKRRPNQVYVHDLGPEPAWFADLNYCLMTEVRWFDGVFNLTSGETPRADLFYTLKYPQEVVNTVKKPSLEEIRHLYLYRKRIAAVWFASHCDTHSLREAYVKELRKYIHVDVFGECGREAPCGARLSTDCFPTIRNDYYFYLAFENSVCPGYNTEKLLIQGLQQVIPVVLKRSIAAEILPHHAFLAADDFTKPQYLAAYMKHLISNEKAYLSYFEWTINPEKYVKDRMEPFDIQLCKWLHAHDLKIHQNSYSISRLMEVFDPEQCLRHFAKDHLIYNQSTREWRLEKWMKYRLKHWNPDKGV